MIGGALSGGIRGGYKGYKYAKELGANPWNRHKIGSPHRFKTIAKPDIEGQADPTKHCYAVAGEYADAGHGNRSRTDFLNAAANPIDGSIPDGAPFSEVANKLGLNIENKNGNTNDFLSLGKLLNKGEAEGVLAIGTDRLHAHMVNVVSFDIIEKFNPFGGGFQCKVENLKIWDPIGAQLRYFSGNILKLIQIKY